MADVSLTSTTYITTRNAVEFEWTGFDGDGDETHAIEPMNMDTLAGGQGRWKPKNAGLYLTTANAGAVADVVDVKVQGSNYGTQWIDIPGLAITDADVDDGGSSAEDSAEVVNTENFDIMPFKFLRILVTTVGVGNTITAKLRISGEN